jgi:hypothetical protein
LVTEGEVALVHLGALRRQQREEALLRRMPLELRVWLRIRLRLEELAKGT